MKPGEVLAWLRVAPYGLGGLLLVPVATLVVTGLLLYVPYDPDPAHAERSVALLSQDEFLRLVHSLHAWASRFALVLVALHLARALWQRIDQDPGKRPMFLAGALLLAALVLGALTGAALRYDTLGLTYAAMLLRFLSVFGDAAAGLGWADPVVGENRYLRFLFRFHVFGVGLALGAALWLHLRLVRRIGYAFPTPGSAGSVSRSHARWVIGAGSILFLTQVFIAAMAAPAPDATRPEWIFRPIFDIASGFGGGAFLGVLLGLLAAVSLHPWLGPGARRGLEGILVLYGLWALRV